MTASALKKENVELKYEIAKGTGLETVLSKRNRTGGGELIRVCLLQSLYSALGM